MPIGKNGQGHSKQWWDLRKTKQEERTRQITIVHACPLREMMKITNRTAFSTVLSPKWLFEIPWPLGCGHTSVPIKTNSSVGKASQIHASTAPLQPSLKPAPQFYISLFSFVPTSLVASACNLFPKFLFCMFTWSTKIHVELKHGVNINVKNAWNIGECTSNSTYLK